MEYYPFKLDRERNIGFGMRAMSIIEKKFNSPISKIDFNSLTIDEIATIMCAGLVHEDKDLTADRFIELVDEYSTMSEIASVMKEAFNMSFGDSEGSKRTKGKNV